MSSKCSPSTRRTDLAPPEMSPPQEITTERLRLRRWGVADGAPFAEMNADPGVMHHFPNTLSRAESDALAEKIASHFDNHGFGLWAVEIPRVSSFAGFVGLSVPTFRTHFTPCVEIGWRLASERWGQGYATEAAQAVVTYGIDVLALKEIVSFTVPANTRSRRVMKGLGMTHAAADDFDHPGLPEGHVVGRHVLYRLAAPR